MTSSAAYSISEIAEIVEGTLLGNRANSNVIRFLLCDSRKLLAPQNTLFFALRTDKNDGHRYVYDLLSKGVRCFVVENTVEKWVQRFPEASFIQHNNPLIALQKLAAYHRSKFSIDLLAITGSNGKTVVKEWLHQLLFRTKRIVKNPKSYNSQIGVPLSVWLIEPDHELGIFEAGISLPGEMKYLQRILQPGTGIFTNIGPAHDEGFIDRDQKILEKLELFASCKSLIYCRDQKLVHEVITQWGKKHPHVKMVSWGNDPASEIHLINIEKTQNETVVSAKYNEKSLLFSVPFNDDASVENALHCMAYMIHSGYSDDLIISNMSKLQPVAMRLEMKEGINDSIIINDTYNSDLHSLNIALDFLNSQTRYDKKTLILSDILQSGIDSKELYEIVAGLLKTKLISNFIGIGPQLSAQSSMFPASAKFFKDTESFIADFDFSAFRRETILVKGARVFGFERIINILQQQDHQTILEIDLDALIHNLNVYRALLLPGTKIMCMVKAFSYGSGTVEIARQLQYHQVDCLAVAYADEGKLLRQGGVTIPIVVMNPEIRTFETLFKYRLEPEIYGFPVFKKLIKALSEDHKMVKGAVFPIHIKIDTGMHRLGFLPEEIDRLISLLREHPQIRVASVFSHLAASEDPEHDEFSKIQIKRLLKVCIQMEQQLGYSFLRHIANSAAISRFPEAHLDMVRPGIGLYGVSGDKGVQALLKNVSTFRSLISQVKKVRKGDSIGYGRKALTEKDMVIAIVPVGYADGLSRRLGNQRGKLLVKGKKAPIVGNISMDMCAIDITGRDAREGDEVIVFGEGLTVQEVADNMGTIPYEVLTSVSQRVKRIYYQE